MVATFKLTFMLDKEDINANIEPMNRLPSETRTQLLHLLCEGSSIRAGNLRKRVMDPNLTEVAAAIKQLPFAGGDDDAG